jgi:hypothetical protein
MNTEKIYDTEIAPKLLEIAKICEANGIPFLALVEWAPGNIGRTELRTKDECLEMIMVRHCAKTAPNIDGYVLGLAKWANKEGIDMRGSFVMRPYIDDNKRLHSTSK